jgi:hypothetical protein
MPSSSPAATNCPTLRVVRRKTLADDAIQRLRPAATRGCRSIAQYGAHRIAPLRLDGHVTVFTWYIARSESDGERCQPAQIRRRLIPAHGGLHHHVECERGEDLRLGHSHHRYDFLAQPATLHRGQIGLPARIHTRKVRLVFEKRIGECHATTGMWRAIAFTDQYIDSHPEQVMGNRGAHVTAPQHQDAPGGHVCTRFAVGVMFFVDPGAFWRPGAA